MIKRERYLKKLKLQKDTDSMKIITGFRRCGKTTLLKQFIEYLTSEEGISKENIIHMNFELSEFDKIKNEHELYLTLKKQIKNKKRYYIFLDEIGRIPKWEETIKRLKSENDVDIYLTGSNKYLISPKALSGNYVEIEMLPLSFKEFLETRYLDSSLTITEKFHEYMKNGSIPLVSELPPRDEMKKDVFIGIYDSILIEDIIMENKVSDVKLIKYILKYLVENTGKTITAKGIVNHIKEKYKKSVSHTTVSNYLKMLENAYMIYNLKKYDIRKKEVLKTPSKYYLVDTGIGNFLTGEFNKQLLESVVYFELIRKGYEIKLGKYYNDEIDFIITKDNVREYCQVKETVKKEEIRKKEANILKRIPDNYEKTIFTLDRDVVRDTDGIKYKSIIDFLLE